MIAICTLNRYQIVKKLFSCSVLNSLVMDLEKGLPIEEHVEENIMEVIGNPATTSSADVPPPSRGNDLYAEA